MHPKMHNITPSTATTDKKIISTCTDEPNVVSGGILGGLTVIVDEDTTVSEVATLKRGECVKIQYI